MTILSKQTEIDPGGFSFWRNIMLNTFQLLLADWDLGLTEATFLLASLALPWMWLLGLSIPLAEHSADQLDRNLKLAKQNKRQNIIKIQ